MSKDEYVEVGCIALIIGGVIALAILTVAVIVWMFQVHVLVGFAGVVLVESIPFAVLIVYFVHLLGGL